MCSGYLTLVLVNWLIDSSLISSILCFKFSFFISSILFKSGFSFWFWRILTRTAISILLWLASKTNILYLGEKKRNMLLVGRHSKMDFDAFHCIIYRLIVFLQSWWSTSQTLMRLNLQICNCCSHLWKLLCLWLMGSWEFSCFM